MNYVIKKAQHDEYPKYAEHLKRLDDHSKFMRFSYRITNEGIDKFCNNVVQHPSQHVLFVVNDANGNFIAVAHIALDEKVELAFSILKDHQNKGLGKLLMEKCILWCWTQGIQYGFITCLSTNHAMKHLCLKYGLELHTDHGEVTGEIEFFP